MLARSSSKRYTRFIDGYGNAVMAVRFSNPNRARRAEYGLITTRKKICALKLKSIGLTLPIARNLPRYRLNAQSGSVTNAWQRLGELWLVSRIGWMEISRSV
jgi:hypothetical protein